MSTSEARRARLAVSLLSATYGVLVGGWSARVPDIRATSGASEATWGLANSIEVAVAMGAMAVVVAMAGRLRPRRLAVLGAVVMLVDAPLAASAPTVGLLIAGLVVWACAGALFETPVHTLQLEVQETYGRSLLGSFGACWSFGSFAGAGLGIVAAAAGVTPGVQLGACSALLGCLLLLAWRWLPAAGQPVRETRERSWVRRRLTPQLLLLVAISFLTAYVASAGEQWSAIYTADTLGAGATLGATTYTAWVLANAGGLLVVDRLATGLGLVRLFRWSMAAAAVALAVGLSIGSPAAAIAGFAVLGLCSAGVNPVVVSLAGRQPGLTPAEGVSVVQLGQPPGFLVSPLVVGALASALDLRWALGTAVVALLAAAALAGWLSRSRLSSSAP